MTISTLSPKNQTTLSIEFVRQLKLHAGMRLQQTVEDGKIILQPVPDVLTAFGALKPKRKFVSIEAETKGMEKAVGKQIGAKGRKAVTANACLLDTNVLLRFLTNDHPGHSAAAKKLFEDAGSGKISLRIPFIVITETIFTLQSYYGIDRADIGRELLKLLTAPGVILTCPGWVLEAVEDYQAKNVSFGDACLAAEARADQLTIASFDRGLAKFIGIKRQEPKA